MRIAIAGFQHETNTFVSTPTDLADFEQADSWPELLLDDNVISQARGMNLPISGFTDACEDDVTLLPILWCAAEPGGYVTNRAFETVVTRITETIRQMPSLDAVYLDLHGAMVTESHEDGEGEILSRVRAVIGEDLPLVASLDMHANVTSKMVATADLLTIYRTYPHIDMAETGARAYRMLRNLITSGRPAKAWRQTDFLIPLHAQHTGADPARALYQKVATVETESGQFADMALGFTASDIHDAGPSVVAYASTQDKADAIASDLLNELSAAKQEFDVGLLTPDDAVMRALSNRGSKPVVIADVQDNPGAGATSDTTGLLSVLIQHRAKGSILGLIHDPELAALAHERGKDSSFFAQIGGRGPGDEPLNTNVRVIELSDGRCRYSGEMYGGGVATLGPSAALEIEDTGIEIVVTSIRNQCLDLAQFRHFNLSPDAARIICVKSTAHFRADFAPIAQEILLTAAPGQFPCELQHVQYRNLRGSVSRTLK